MKLDNNKVALVTGAGGGIGQADDASYITGRIFEVSGGYVI